MPKAKVSHKSPQGSSALYSRNQWQGQKSTLPRCGADSGPPWVWTWRPAALSTAHDLWHSLSALSALSARLAPRVVRRSTLRACSLYSICTQLHPVIQSSMVRLSTYLTHPALIATRTWPQPSNSGPCLVLALVPYLTSCQPLPTS